VGCSDYVTAGTGSSGSAGKTVTVAIRRRENVNTTLRRSFDENCCHLFPGNAVQILKKIQNAYLAVGLSTDLSGVLRK
jgi:hypothetical protein